MADVVITATTPGPCGCCAPPVTPAVVPYCISTVESECTFPGPASGVYPGSCLSTFQCNIPCIDPPGGANVTVTVQVRLHCTGIRIGHNYAATIRFISNLGDISSYTWNFAASATTEDTPFIAQPNPPGFCEDPTSWAIDSYDIVEV